MQGGGQMTRHSTSERFKLVIEDAGGADLEDSKDSRLKRLLKTMLRQFAFRLVEIHPSLDEGTMKEGSDT
jgi:hypothetical protein